MIGRALQLWRRRYWRADAAQIAAFDGLTPFKVITGGSDGIGLALAEGFARLDDSILIIGRDEDRLRHARARIEAAYPATRTGRLATLSLDVTTGDACAKIDAKLVDLSGICDVLVNSAGIGAAGPFHANDAARLDELTALNVMALTRLCRHYLPGMVTRGRGGLLNVASLAGYTPGPFQAAYYASKSYVISLTEAIAHECKGQGVRVAVLAPGAVQTDFHARMRGETGLYLLLMPFTTPQRVARSALLRFRLGQRVIVHGFRNKLLMLSLRTLPHRLTMPIVGFMLKPRWEADHGSRQP